MSDTDSFISEVNDEVRRDRLYFLLRRYGWLAGLVVALIVGGAAFSEYRKSQERAQAEALGDAIISALGQDDAAARQSGLMSITPETAGAQAIVGLLASAEAQQNNEADTAIAVLDRVAVNGDAPAIYRQIATFKSLLLQADTMDPNERRQQLTALAAPGAPLSLLAQEQLALMDVAEGNTEGALQGFQAIIQDASVSSDLQQRALQVIVALGGTPELNNLPDLAN